MLEILSPSAEHDRISRIVAALVELPAEEADMDVENAGSTTFKREDLSRGFEPDECFYFGAAARVRQLVAGKGNLELDARAPAPDLVEVDITSPSLDKLPIYACRVPAELLGPDVRNVTLRVGGTGNYRIVANSRKGIKWCRR